MSGRLVAPALACLLLAAAACANGGGQRAAALAKEAFKTGKTIRQIAQERKLMPDAELNKIRVRIAGRAALFMEGRIEIS